MPEPKKAKITPRQRRALELFLRQLSDALNDAGLSIPVVLEESVDVDWSHDTAKELIWKPVQRWLTRKRSTTQLDKQGEINLIYKHLVRHFGEKFGMEIPEWPAFESEAAFIKDTTS